MSRLELKSLTIFETITLDYDVPKLPVITKNEPQPKAAANETKPPVITKNEPQTQTTTNNDVVSDDAAKDELLAIPEALPLLDNVSLVSCDVNYLRYLSAPVSDIA